MNQINKRTLIIAGVSVLVVIAVGVGLFLAKEFLWPRAQEVVVGDPVDVVIDFYQPWLEALQATSTNPYKLGLTKAPVLSKELRKRLKASEKPSGAGLDPVLCQSGVPTQIATRPISELEDKAQVLVVSRDKTETEQAIVSLIRLNDGWYIDDIRCSPGEFGPEREFSFDMEGYLLKTVPPPYNPQYWHLVFVENGVPGHAAPLFFNAESTCTAPDETQAVCDPSTFIEPAKAYVQGEMTETGVKVKRLKLFP